MHGELMELNDRLQRSLLNKEGIIVRLKTELETLRGPLFESDEEDSVGPALVSLWIPSVFLAGNNSPHHVYQVTSITAHVFDNGVDRVFNNLL